MAETTPDDDAHEVEEIDGAVRELLVIAEDEKLSALTRVKTWGLICELSRMRAEILGLDLA